MNTPEYIGKSYGLAYQYGNDKVKSGEMAGFNVGMNIGLTYVLWCVHLGNEKCVSWNTRIAIPEYSCVLGFHEWCVIALPCAFLIVVYGFIFFLEDRFLRWHLFL